MKGLDLANSLVGVLTRFSKNKVALVADVKAMFHQIKVDARDQNALRFLWWTKGDQYCIKKRRFIKWWYTPLVQLHLQVAPTFV